MAITKNDLKGVLKAYHVKISGLLSNKVDKISGKDLSTNDYTTEEKNKLAGISTGAQVNQNAFSIVKVGTTNIEADSITDTLEIVAGSNITITPDETYDKITISSTNTIYSTASSSINGLMSSTDKSKLDGIEPGANNYIHPDTTLIRHVTDAEKTLWNEKETTSGAQAKADAVLTSAKSYTDTKVAALVSSAPETLDTLNELATALGNDPNFATTVATQIGTKIDKVEGMGLSSNDYTTIEKNKLAGIAANANNYTHPTGDGNLHVPATSTTNSGKVLTAGATAGSLSWVALPTSLPANGGNADTIDGKHATDFATASHDHNNTYYTEAEIDSKLSTIISSSNSYVDSKMVEINTDLTDEEITALVQEILA